MKKRGTSLKSNRVETDISPINVTTNNLVIPTIGGNSKIWRACTHSEIHVLPLKKPKFGSETSGTAPWSGVLLDNGYNDARNATRLHVINAHFGGKGGNSQNNLHPGSQQLNKNHLVYAENLFKEILDDEQYKNCKLKYSCDFNWGNYNLLHLSKGANIDDPTITCKIEAIGRSKYFISNITVPKGNNMKRGLL